MIRALAWLGLAFLGACSNDADVNASADSAAAERAAAADAASSELNPQASSPPVDQHVPPSYPLRFLDQAAADPVRWEARLIERDPKGFCTFWSWRVLEKGAPDPLLTYESVEHAWRDDMQLLAEVRQRGGDWLARSQVPSARGIHTDAIDMQLIQVAVFGGGVLDGESNPVMNAELRLYQAEGSRAPVFYSHPHLAWTNAKGEFRFGGVEPGNYWLRVVSEGRPPVVLQLKLEGGDSSAYELKMTTLENTAQLPVAVLGVNDTHLPSALLTLRSVDDQSVWRVAHSRTKDEPLSQLVQAGVGYAGLFPQLPEGRYELAVLGLDSNPYSPASILLEFGALDDGIRIQAEPAPVTSALRFQVKAKGSDEALRDCYLRFSSDSWWASEPLILQPTEKAADFAPNMPTPQWMVGHVGYQPVFGTFRPGDPDSEVESDPNGTLENLELVPGWGCELLFRDGRERLPAPESDTWKRTGIVRLAAPLKGVIVYADGEEIARSDGTGRVRLLLPMAPAELIFEIPGWQELPHYLTGFLDPHNLPALEASGSTVVWFDRRE